MGLYISYSIFRYSLYCRAVDSTENLCTMYILTKKRIDQFLSLKSVVYKQERFQIKNSL